MHGPRSRLLGSGILLLVIATLALAACSSDSVSGSQPKTSQATPQEAKSSPGKAGSSHQGLIDAAIAKTR